MTDNGSEVIENAQRANYNKKFPYILEIVRASPGLPNLRANPRFPRSFLQGSSIVLFKRKIFSQFVEVKRSEQILARKMVS
jgi:hypothetical protein